MGLSLLDTTIEKGSYKANVPDKTKKDTLHFRHFLRQFAGHVTQGDRLTKREEEHLEKLGAECASFLSMKAYDSYYYTQVLSILTDMFKKFMPQVGSQFVFVLIESIKFYEFCPFQLFTWIETCNNYNAVVT